MPTASCSAGHMWTANDMARAFFLKILWVSRSVYGSQRCLGLSIVETAFLVCFFLGETRFGLSPLPLFLTLLWYLSLSCRPIMINDPFFSTPTRPHTFLSHLHDSTSHSQHGSADTIGELCVPLKIRMRLQGTYSTVTWTSQQRPQSQGSLPNKRRTRPKELPLKPQD